MFLIKRQRVLSESEREEARIWALWLAYGRTPSKAEPDVDGYFDLQEIGETRSDRGVVRWCPYSTSPGLRP